MAHFSDRFATLKADLRQRIQLLRARIERAQGIPYFRRRAAASPASWEEAGSWSADEGGPPPTMPDTPPDGLMSRPRTVHEATERLRNRRSLLRRQQTRRAL